ncbi:MAG TPA: hypothetical protein VGN12_09585 [Pirellulales bacterium]
MMKKRSRMVYALWAVVVMALYGGEDAAPCFADEAEGLALLVNAAKHAGDRQIRTGEFTYTRRITRDPPTDKEIQRLVEQVRAALRRQLETVKNERARASIQKSIDDAEADIAPQMKANANQEWQCEFALRDPDHGGDKYSEFFRTDQEPGHEKRMAVLLRAGLTLEQHQENLAIVGSAGIYLGQEPQRAGRLTGFLLQRVAGDGEEIIRNLKDTVSEIEVGNVNEDRPSNTRKVTCWFTAIGVPRTQVTVHIDTLRDYVTPLVREADEEGNVLREWIAETYFQPEGTELWFPQSVTYREYLHPQRPSRNVVERYEFPQDGVAINAKIADERFTIVLPAKSTLLDSRTKENISYKTTEEVKLSLDALEDLNSVSGLERGKK